jgi:DNL zinc finger
MRGLLVVCLLVALESSLAFSPVSRSRSSAASLSSLLTSVQLSAHPRRRNSSRHEGDNDDAGASGDGKNNQKTDKIPQLPAVGATSLGLSGAMQQDDNASVTSLTGLSAGTPVASVVSRKFQLSYTCQRCETRNSHWVSRRAYRQGVVIARCQGCQVQHLLADHLDYTNLSYPGTLEDYFAQQGQTDQVSRVGPDVYHLESLINMDTESGSLRDKEGRVHLE